eukprot:275908_1
MATSGIYGAFNVDHYKHFHQNIAVKLWDEFPNMLQVVSVRCRSINITFSLKTATSKKMKYKLQNIDDNDEKICQKLKLCKNSNTIKISVETKADKIYKFAVFLEEKQMSNIVTVQTPVENAMNNYTPLPPLRESVKQYYDENKENILIVWDYPKLTFGDKIIYKIKSTNKIEEEQIITLPYILPITSSATMLSITTISIIDNKSYQSQSSEPIFIDLPDFKYPKYITKAIFSGSHDKHVEVLLDQAINFLANDSRFTHLWYNHEFVKSMYNKTAFFTQFLTGEFREYDHNEDYALPIDANETSDKYTLKWIKQENKSSDNTENKNATSWNTTLKWISDSPVFKWTYRSKKTTNKNNIENEFDMKFKIRKYVKNDHNEYKRKKTKYFELPNCTPNPDFMWAQYKRKKIQRFGRKRMHGYWKLLKKKEEKQEEKSNDNNDTEKRKPKPSPISVQHLNLILGLMRFYLKQKHLMKTKKK